MLSLHSVLTFAFERYSDKQAILAIAFILLLAFVAFVVLPLLLKESNISELEKKINDGQIEEVILQVSVELNFSMKTFF